MCIRYKIINSLKGDGKGKLMLHKISLKCKYKGEEKPSYNWGSVLHGALMELLPGELSDEFHENKLKPFSQHVLLTNENILKWNIRLWGSDDISEAIIRTVMPLTQIELKHKGSFLEVVGVECENEKEDDFFARFFSQEMACRRYELEFVTPSTHKSAGVYVLFPTPELIIQSIHMRLAAFLQDFSLDDPEVLLQIASHLCIVRYFLRSAPYYLEGTRIPGYLGRITLSIRGPEQLAKLTGALLSLSEYTGIGVKTALGMGGCRVLPLSNKNMNINGG